MLKDCIGIFQKKIEHMGNERGNADALILDNYIPADGDYIVVKKDGSVVKCSIKMDKKAGRPVKDLSDGDSQYEDIVFYDYHSRLVSMDKPQDPKKVIHSNNYLSFWIKKESLTNGKLNMEGIDRYFDILSNPRSKYKNAKDSKMYDYIFPAVGEVNQEKLEQCRNWIKQHIFNLKDFGIDTSGKNYLKVFFEDDRDLYINEEKRYLMTKIYNKNDYNIDIDEQIYGLPNDNLALNSKKPYMEHKTRKNVVPYLITPEEAATQRKFFDYLMNEANRGYTNIFFDSDEDEIIPKKPGEFITDDFSGFFIQIQKGKELSIQHQDAIVDYKYNLYKHFQYRDVIGSARDEDVYKEYVNKKQMLAVLDEVIFSKCLSRNFFTDDINVNPELKRNIIISRDAIFAWLYKGQDEGIDAVLHNVCINTVRDSINNGYMNKVIMQFNFMKSLEEYFGGVNMADRYSDIRKNLSDKINKKGYSQIESDEEYFYAVGQLVYYFISLNKSKDKKHSLANPFFNARNNELLQKKITQFFKKYNYIIGTTNLRFNNLYSMVSSYELTGRVKSEEIIAGYISSNLIYDSANKEED